MRKFTTIVAALLLSVATFAQAPQGFSYQAVVRDAQNAIVANQEVDVTLTITAEIDGLAIQTYTEKHSVTTNANGLLTLVVGQGESSQKLSDIKWNMPNAIYNMRTETAYGTATTQLLSVPFAMYAEQAGELDYQKLAKTLSSNDVQELLGYVKAEDLAKLRDLINDSLAAYGNTYIKKTDVNVLTNNYITKDVFENYVLSGGQANAVDLTVYAKTADVETVYAKKSDIPSAPDLSNYVQTETLGNYALSSSVASNYVTKEAFDNYVLSGGQADAVDLTVYAKSADIEKTYAKKADIPSLNGYAKTADIAEQYMVKTTLANVATTGSYNDLTDKPTIPTIPTKVSELQNDANYLTSHQDISGKQDAITDLAAIRSGAALGATALQEHQSLADYAKTADIEAAFATKTDVAAKVDKIEGKSLSTNDFTNDLKSKLENEVLTANDIEGKADKSEMSITPLTGADADKATIQLKEGTSATVLTEHQSLADYATVAQLQEQIEALQAAMANITKNANQIGSMPLAMVNVVIENSIPDETEAQVSFLGKTLTSGTTTFKIPAYSPVFLSVALSKYTKPSDGKFRAVNYNYEITINGREFDPTLGYYYLPSNGGPVTAADKDAYYYGSTARRYVGYLEYPSYWPESGKSNIILWNPIVNLDYDKVPIYKKGSGIVYDPLNEYVVATDAERNLVNQVVGPFTEELNTIKIKVTRSGGEVIIN